MIDVISNQLKNLIRDYKNVENEIALEEDVATAEELVSNDESKLETVSKEDAK